LLIRMLRTILARLQSAERAHMANAPLDFVSEWLAKDRLGFSQTVLEAVRRSSKTGSLDEAQLLSLLRSTAQTFEAKHGNR
jgi:hypothetical protein